MLPQTVHSVTPSTRALIVHVPRARQHVGRCDGSMTRSPSEPDLRRCQHLLWVCLPFAPRSEDRLGADTGRRPPHPGVAAPPGSGPSKLGIVFRGRSTVSGALAPIGSYPPGQGEGCSKVTSYLFSLLLSPTLARSMVFSFGLCPFLIASGLPLPLPLGVGGRTQTSSS